MSHKSKLHAHAQTGTSTDEWLPGEHVTDATGLATIVTSASQQASSGDDSAREYGRVQHSYAAALVTGEGRQMALALPTTWFERPPGPRPAGTLVLDRLVATPGARSLGVDRRETSASSCLIRVFVGC